MRKSHNTDERIVYCLCPYCRTKREKRTEGYSVVRRGYERNGLARFLCKECGAWFNEKTGNSMSWYSR